ncbi:MAG: 50S ribosomal protein L23 [Bifidobacterium choerinum]
MVAVHKPAHDIILKPVVSEKSYALSDMGQYTFVVAPDSNKVQIKQAIEEIFKVKVTTVNTLNRAGKRTRTRTGYGRRVNEKRAIVTVAEGQSIDIFGN